METEQRITETQRMKTHLARSDLVRMAGVVVVVAMVVVVVVVVLVAHALR